MIFSSVSLWHAINQFVMLYGSEFVIPVKWMFLWICKLSEMNMIQGKYLPSEISVTDFEGVYVV
jgi:hypothetical protein